jgi:hypothetical protein
VKKRPLSVIVISCLFTAAGLVGLAYHASEFKARPPLEYALVCFVRLLAILCGVFMLRAHNWARWLALAWLGYHVVLSALHSTSELVTHAVLLAAIAFFLFRPRVSAYFRGMHAEPPRAA